MRNARVFISCGQREERETTVGDAVEEHFKVRGFETYLAERVHSSEGLTENIFRMLRESEYYVWIDFKRDKIASGEHRGSLFVNQELAIATFLQLPLVGFVEKGVKREGISNYQIFNAIPFCRVEDILEQVQRHTLDWDSASVNELAIVYDRGTNTVAAADPATGQSNDFFHLAVRNRHMNKHAFSCCAYVADITDRETGNNRSGLPTVELNWAGLGHHEVTILANGQRDVDAFLVPQGQNVVQFHTRQLRTNNPRYTLPSLDPGAYRIKYGIVSANFPVAEASFDLDFDGSSAGLKLCRVEPA